MELKSNEMELQRVILSQNLHELFRLVSEFWLGAFSENFNVKSEAKFQ